MPAANLRQRWSQGEVTLGAAVRLGSTWVAEVFAARGFDFVWLDYQHGINSLDNLMPMLQAMNGTRTTSLVRVPANDPAVIGRFLDAGAEGIIVPMVETEQDAARAVSSCRYLHPGARSYGGLRTKYLPGGWQRDLLCIAMVETTTGVENVKEIAAVDGIDGIFLGPADLAFSMGLTPDQRSNSSEYAQAIARIRTACHDAGIVYGATGTVEELAAQGAQMISVGADNLFIEQAIDDILGIR